MIERGGCNQIRRIRFKQLSKMRATCLHGMAQVQLQETNVIESRALAYGTAREREREGDAISATSRATRSDAIHAHPIHVQRKRGRYGIEAPVELKQEKISRG